MIRVRLRIDDGGIYDTFEKWGMIYLSSDNRTGAPIKARDVTSYPEEAGEHTDERTVEDAFDYKAKFLIETKNSFLTSANAKIKAFNDAIRESATGSDVKRYKTIEFFNDYKRVKIIGIPEPISEATSFYRDKNGVVMDCVEVELKIRVDRPSLCDFNLGDPENFLLENGSTILLEDGNTLMLD